MAEGDPTPPTHKSGGKLSGALKKRVFGVPVLYLAVLVVAVLVFYAWRLKASPSAADTAPLGEDPTIDGTPDELLPKLPVGTVVVTPGPPDTGGNASIETNDEWIRKGVAFLIKRGVTGGTAQVALATYLDGGALTYAQGVMRDQVIAEYGLPPTILPTGTTGPKPIPKPPPVKPPRVSQRTAHPWPGKSIGMGDKGGNVKFIQSRVKAVQSGVFDKWTELHVRQWQARQKLPQDGRIDKVDWERMFPA